MWPVDDLFVRVTRVLGAERWIADKALKQTACFFPTPTLARLYHVLARLPSSQLSDGASPRLITVFRTRPR